MQRAVVPMGKPEGTIENYLRDRCRHMGYICFKFAPCGINGIPDRIVIGNGQTVFVELKAPGERPRKNQIAIHRKMRAAGAVVYVIDNKPDVDALLEAISSR